MTTSLAISVYLIFMIVILVAAAHFTKAKNLFHSSEDPEGQGPAEEPVPEKNTFVETTETVEFSEAPKSTDGPVIALLPSGHKHKLYLCQIGVTAPPGVDVYVAEGITLMVEPIQTVHEPLRAMEYDYEARLQFPDGEVHYVTRCYGGSTDEIGIEVFAGAGITLIVKNRKLVNY